MLTSLSVMQGSIDCLAALVELDPRASLDLEDSHDP